MKNVKKMTGVALLMALVVVPIVMGAALYGPQTGALLGAAFGVVVVIGCISGTDVGGAMVFQANPILCVLVVMGKGILAGFLSGVVYAALKQKNSTLAMVLAAAVCPVVNTGTFVLCMAAFFMDVLSVWAGGSNVLGYILSGLMLCNFVPELVINLIFSGAGVRILKSLDK